MNMIGFNLYLAGVYGEITCEVYSDEQTVDGVDLFSSRLLPKEGL